MKKFIQIKSLSRHYVDIQNKVRQNYRLVDNMKLLITVLIFLFTLWVYWYFVNISSTKWYFLRMEMRNLEEKKFEHSIVQIETLKKEREIWDNISIDRKYNQPKMVVDERVLYISYDHKKVFWK